MRNSVVDVNMPYTLQRISSMNWIGCTLNLKGIFDYIVHVLCVLGIDTSLPKRFAVLLPL